MFGEGKYGKATVRYGQYTKGLELSYAEPFLLGYRMSGGIDLFAKQSEPTPYLTYGSEVYGTTLRLGFALTEEVKLGLRYSIYQQDITLSRHLNNCIKREQHPVQPDNKCYDNGEAALPVRIELAQGRCPDLAGWLHAWLQYRRRQPESDKGHRHRFQAGFCGRRRRREFHPFLDRFPQVSGDPLRRRRRPPPAGRELERMGRQGPADARSFPARPDARARLRSERHRASRGAAR